LVLAGVEMTPTAFRLMIVQGALDVALGTAPVHFAVGSTQLHAFDSPGTLHS
jgi:hypothetical protein